MVTVATLIRYWVLLKIELSNNYQGYHQSKGCGEVRALMIRGEL
jgi:hypothetical protein